jgi:hypothetical protein
MLQTISKQLRYIINHHTRIKGDQRYFVLYHGRQDKLVSKIMYGKELVDINPKKVMFLSKHAGK